MRKGMIAACFIVALGLLFSTVNPQSASAQIAKAILYEQENAPRWIPANNDGSTYPFVPGESPAQGFGVRLERGTDLNGGVVSPVHEELNGLVSITATSIVRRFGPSEIADLGRGVAFGRISINDDALRGSFAGIIDLTDVEITSVGTIAGRYHLRQSGPGLRLNGPIEGVFLFPIDCGLIGLPVELCPTGFVYSLDNDLQPNFTPVGYPDEFVPVPGFGEFPAVKLIAFLSD